MTDEELIARLRDPAVFGTQTAIEAADRIEALGREKTYLLDRAMEQDDRTEAAEARLAKAVEALRVDPWIIGWRKWRDISRTTLAEIGGEG